MKYTHSWRCDWQYQLIEPLKRLLYCISRAILSSVHCVWNVFYLILIFFSTSLHSEYFTILSLWEEKYLRVIKMTHKKRIVLFYKFDIKTRLRIKYIINKLPVWNKIAKYEDWSSFQKQTWSICWTINKITFLTYIHLVHVCTRKRLIPIFYIYNLGI